MDSRRPPARLLRLCRGLLADFDRYLDQEHIDLRRDGAAYRMAGLWLTDQELGELILRTIMLPASDPAPREAATAVDAPGGGDRKLRERR